MNALLLVLLLIVNCYAAVDDWSKIIGEVLYRWNDDGSVEEVYSNEALKGKTVALYFSASWCRPCQQFTPMLVKLYKEMKRKGKPLEVVWISQDRTTEDYVAYYQKMPWLALPPDEIATLLPVLTAKYKATGIPHLVVLDTDTTLITTDGRTMVAKDPYGLEFPWKSPSRRLTAFIPRAVRKLVSSQVRRLQQRLSDLRKGVISGLAPSNVLGFVKNSVLPSLFSLVKKLFGLVKK